MHFYLVDDFVVSKKFEPELNRVEARLTEIGIHGRMEKLTVLKSVVEVIDEAVRRGADTIVVVGDDRTVSKMVSIVAQHGVPFGLIPIGPHQAIAEFLGIPHGAAAVEILARRVKVQVDLGKVGDRYFLMSLDVPESRYALECDGRYRVSLAAAEPMRVCNLGRDETGTHDPHDGVLEAVIGAPRKGFWSFGRAEARESVFPFKKMTITSEQPLAMTLDGQTVVKTPVTVEASSKRLKVIVGRERKF
ncbi:MAG: NAD(+)/NADH kinase [Candidatus Kerfeldbacteria bacterium]|nr:NAD(+)/NADH kinase [Candidatus Kerfeldbacteria bacterium]